MNYYTFVLQTSAQETQEVLLYSTHKRPLLLESQNHTYWRQGQNHRERYDEHCHPSTMQVLISLQRVHSTTEWTDHHLRHPNTRWEWDVVTVSGKILNVKDQRQVGSPCKQLNLMEAVLGDVRATIPLDLWESQIDKVQQGKLIKVYIFQPVPKDSFHYVFFLIQIIFCAHNI